MFSIHASTSSFFFFLRCDCVVDNHVFVYCVLYHVTWSAPFSLSHRKHGVRASFIYLAVSTKTYVSVCTSHTPMTLSPRLVVASFHSTTLMLPRPSILVRSRSCTHAKRRTKHTVVVSKTNWYVEEGVWCLCSLRMTSTATLLPLCLFRFTSISIFVQIVWAAASKRGVFVLTRYILTNSIGSETFPYDFHEWMFVFPLRALWIVVVLVLRCVYVCRGIVYGDIEKDGCLFVCVLFS